jgi:hypothetical protein
MIKLIAFSANDGQIMSRKFKLRVPAVSFDLTKEEVIRPLDEQVADYLERFLLTDRKYQEEVKGGYVRMMVFQDEPTSSPYLYVYWREIKEAPEDHQACLNEIAQEGEIPGEINFQRGHFFSFPREALRRAKVKVQEITPYD